MNYRPDPKNLGLWDTWMFADPDGRRMHLFFLAGKPNEAWGGIGHAVSSDLVHWDELPLIPAKRPDDTYDPGVIGTGMVFDDPAGGFQLAYTTDIFGKTQRVSFMHSHDLITWEKIKPDFFIDAQPPYYATDARNAVSDPPAFRDPFIVNRGDHFEALIAGHGTYGPPVLPACIARYRSTDLKNWQPLPPLLGPGVTLLIEVPEYHEINGKHYLLYSTTYLLGVDCSTRTRRSCWGTFYAVADSYEGPYRVPEENLLLGAGNCPGTWHAAIGRMIRWNNEWFLYHQIAGPPLTATGLIKRVVQKSDGSLVARYWPGVEKLHQQEIHLPLEKIQVQGEVIHIGDWQPVGQNSLTGTIDGGGSLGLIPGSYEDFHLRCRVTLDSGTNVGISVRDPGRGISPVGVALQADVKHGEWQFGGPCHAWCSYIQPVEIITEAPQIGKTYQIDIFLRDIFFEAYVDGEWKFTRCIQYNARRGGIGFYVENGSARFEDIQIWSLEPMTNPYPEAHS